MCVERVEQGTQNAACGAPTFRVMEFEVCTGLASPLEVCR